MQLKHRNRRRKFIVNLKKGLAAFLAASFVLSTPRVVYADRVSEIRQQIEEANRQKEETEGQKAATEEHMGNMNEAVNSLEGQLSNLTTELTDISNNLEEIEGKIIDKQEEIRITEAELEEAQKNEATQYENMKKHLRAMYEKKDSTYLELLLSSKSISDVLNRSQYIELLEAYDQKMLAQLKATRETIEEKKATLLSEKEELDGLQAEAADEKSKISTQVKNTKNNIAGYESEIAAAQEQVTAYEAQIARQEEDLAALWKQLEEEIAKSKLAAQSSWRDISEVTFSEEDRYLLANLIYCEAGNQPYAGQLAVGAVVINRVLSSVYPNTVSGVIYQHKQFAPVLDGHLALALAENRATAACYKAADEAMSGATNVGNCVYFRTPIEGLTGIQIGDHIFY